MDNAGQRLSLAELDQITGSWYAGIRDAHVATEQNRQLELHKLQLMRDELGTVPGWAEEISAALPNWGFEICSHRWLDGLDEILQMIEEGVYHKSSIGRCGDIPSMVIQQADRRLQVVEQWQRGKDAGTDEFGRQLHQWLGEHTPDKEIAVTCLLEVVRAFLFSSEETASAVSQKWRKQADGNELLARLFYGDGLDGGLQNACGYATLRRLDIYLRVIGGDDTHLPETRWICNTTMRFALRDDPARMDVTQGFLWGLYAYLTSGDAAWLREHSPECAATAIWMLNRLTNAGTPPDAVRRWLAASLLSSIKFWYSRALNFIGTENSPAPYHRVPDLLFLKT